MEKLPSPRAIRYATDPAYRARIRDAQAKRYAESQEFRLRQIARSKERRLSAQAARAKEIAAWKMTDEYKADVAARKELKRVENIARVRRWLDQHPDRARDSQRLRREQHPGRQAHYAAMARFERLCVVPEWANPVAIFRFYEAAATMNKYMHAGLHVDHIVPINSPLVCGLHCEANLQVVPAQYNMSKGNRTWPDMPGGDE